MQTIIGYLRVSTQRQSQSGLGLEAQQMALESYAQSIHGTIIKTYVEIETGKNSNRPELQKALSHAKRSKSRLVVAKLDRLARNVAFTAALMENGVDFVACDMPTANRLTVHILAAVAEAEAKAISDRTKSALAAYKARGGTLGAKPGTCPIPIEARKKGAKLGGAVMAQNAREAYADVLPAIISWRADGMSQKQIADRLNLDGFTTSTGGIWHQGHVCQLLKRMSG